MASNERMRELALLADPETQAWVERAANRLVGVLLSEGRFVDSPATASEDDSAFADRLIRCELGLIADGAHPFRVALRVAVLRAARDALVAHHAIRALPEIAAGGVAGRSVAGGVRGSLHG
jgi:hypothetical protein